ncbi:pilus assembly FimT family protein [Deinococcus knuensis]|uniref:Prepilin-type N-terminal cleavage/methylation domain-containing protein n=1 Tax=Deinococcus knuensis TaxID=1837380 RepID=A0ABQ2SQZ6_9DEIO|nr:prepilin-type N-terminal cleavage/methylation domain-containing protein [Deinococcus knuensis]GGS35109.1 hypothetical protein GCM10008961_28580 [Deinococcus knuensis]
MNRSAVRTSGFTLLEILIVMAIIGILAAIGYSSYLKTTRSNQVAEGARIFAGDLIALRDAAQKTSVDTRITWTAAPDQAIGNYTMTRSGTATARTPANTVVITCVAATGGACSARTITYAAPYAETSAGAVFKISSAYDSSVRPLFVKVGNVTGKVMFSDQQD